MQTVNGENEVVPDFEHEVVDVLQRLRGRFAELIGAAPGQVGCGADLHRLLGIDRKLSWMVYKVATAKEPLAAGAHVPGSANLKTFFNAAKERGIPQNLIASASQAAQAFENVIIRHAGDRMTFDSMVCGMTENEQAEQTDLQHRRAAYRAQRHIWGIHARTQMGAVIVKPSENPEYLDHATLRGYLSLRQLRPAAPLLVSQMRCTNDDGTIRKQSLRPIDPRGCTPHGIALLSDFCSQPLPEFRTVEAECGFVHCELVSKGLGNLAATTCVTGAMADEAVPRYRDENNSVGLYTARVRTPCEVLIHDVLVHEGTFDGPPSDVAAYGETVGAEPFPGYSRKREWLKFRASVSLLGRGPEAVHTPDAPRYAEMVQYVFDKLGWDAQRFDVYRCRIDYPVLPSTAVITFNLSEHP